MMRPLPLSGALLALALLTLSAPAGAAIYKYVNNGVVTYSEQPPSRGHFETYIPNCETSYLGCWFSNSDWNKVPLNRQAYRNLVREIAHRYEVDAALIRAVIHAESNFNRDAVSRAGAEGLMQLMPKTQASFGVDNAFNPRENIEAGTRLIKQLLEKFRYNVRLMAAAYNAGEDAVARFNGIPPYQETRNYVRRVSELYARYRRAQ